jgi:hypothetical protein
MTHHLSPKNNSSRAWGWNEKCSVKDCAFRVLGTCSASSCTIMYISVCSCHAPSLIESLLVGAIWVPSSYALVIKITCYIEYWEFCVASFFESKICLLSHWISVSSQMLFQVWRCASVMPGLADPLISHSAIHRSLSFQFRTFISFCVYTALGTALGHMNHMHSLNILFIPFCISLGLLTHCVHCICSMRLSFH